MWASLTAAALLGISCDHWAVENRAFWVRDVVLRNVHCRIRTGLAPENTSILKNVVIKYVRAGKVPNIRALLHENAVKVQPLLARLRLPTF